MRLIMNKEISHSRERSVIRKCHKCGQITEAPKEQESCPSCGKSFLPLNYFDKVHDHKGQLKELYSSRSLVIFPSEKYLS